MKKNGMIALALVVGLLNVTGSFANEKSENFKQRHPRRAEVNRREKNQQKRIGNGIKDGKLSPDQASHLEKEEGSIKREERRDVRENGGYLTKKEQKQLNHEENGVSKEIKQDEHQ